MRIPLLKPYELVKIDRKQVGWWSLGWSINLHISPSEKEIYYYLAIHDIKKFAVENGIIIVYTNYQQDVDEDVGQKVLNWFVLIPNQEVEIGFENENEFLDYIHLLGIKTPNWVSPDEAYNQFFETRCLNWIPGCN